MADSSLTLSSSPLRGGGPIGPPRLSSSPRKIETRLSDENDYQDGEISPTLDASFASNLSINNSPEQETGGGMDFSPAAPLASRQQQQRAERPVLTKPRARTLDRAATYDSAFFSKLAAQKRPSADAPKVPSSKPDFTKNRTFGDQLDTNSAPKILPREIGARPLVKKTQSDAILQFQPTQQGKTVPDARPSLQRMRGHSTSSSMGNLLFKVDQSSQALDSEAPSRPWTAMPVNSRRHARSQSDMGNIRAWSFSQPSTSSLMAPPPNHRSCSDSLAPTAASTTYAIPEESPSLDRMDIDSPPLPPDTHSNSMDVDDVSFEALSAKKPAPDSCIRPPALSNCLREEDHSFVGFFAESPAPFASGTQNKLSSPPKTSVTSGRKRNLEPDSSLELSSEDASPSSPLASLAGPVRPSLQKAASAAALFSGQTAVSRRRASDRSIGSRSSTSSVLKPTSSGQSSRRSSNESSPPKKERLQAQKKARADSVDTMASRPRALVNSQRPASGSDVSDKYRPSSAGYSNKSFQQSIGLGLPPPARSSYQSENLSSRPRHIVSASESHMTFANTKRRPASDSHRSIKSSMPPDTRMESDGKRLPCHQVSEDGIMRVKPEVVSDLVQGRYSHLIDRFSIVDCRFPTEFEAGHVDGAVNLNDEAQIVDFFLTPGSGFLHGGRDLPSPCVSDDPGPKPVIIFHCEFSQKRAPAIAKKLRSIDRARGHDYPNVHYPEIYVLAGGYAELFKNYANLCNPSAYLPMAECANGEQAYDSFHCRTKPGFAFSRAKSYSAFENQMANAKSVALASRPVKETRPGLKAMATTSSLPIKEDERNTSIDSSSSSPGGTTNSPCPGQGRARKSAAPSRPPSRPFSRAATTTQLPQQRLFAVT